jgi:hypothetical protein
MNRFLRMGLPVLLVLTLLPNPALAWGWFRPALICPSGCGYRFPDQQFSEYPAGPIDRPWPVWYGWGAAPYGTPPMPFTPPPPFGFHPNDGHCDGQIMPESGPVGPQIAPVTPESGSVSPP